MFENKGTLPTSETAHNMTWLQKQLHFLQGTPGTKLDDNLFFRDANIQTVD
jgi:hypothetical protein